MDDDKMTDEALSTLRLLRTSAPSSEAKKIAINAAMAAFDAAQVKAPRRGTFSGWRIAGFGLPIGAVATAVAALVLLPLGTQLYTATSRHTNATPPVSSMAAATNATSAETAPVVTADKPTAQGAAAPVTLQAPTAVPEPKSADVAPTANGPVNAESADRDVDALVAPMAASPAPMEKLRMAVPAANATRSSGRQSDFVPFATGDTFQKFDENRVKVTRTDPVSTFSIDVDTAAYSYVRGVLKDGELPQPDAVRIEEMINYFPYSYPAPTTPDTPFKATMSVIPTPWNSKTELLEIGIKGYVPPATARKPENLTFLIDTSGSMDEPNKLPLLKRSFGLLVDSLQPDDTVSIVTYAGSAGVALKPTKASDRSTILGAIDALDAEGSTDGVDGIALAYRVNAEAKGEETTNRVILATDGDFNVGIDTPDELKTYIKTQRDQGIGLSVLGFGRGNLDDALMQSLAQNGNGNASYIDNFQEAQKVLVEQGGANFVTIAKDVKVQVEFNPAQVSEYRLIGYETRALNNEDFNNDRVDAGEIGAGHTVTAIYEIAPAGSGGELNDPLRYQTSQAEPTGLASELGFLKIRYKDPDADTSKLISTPITQDLVVKDASKAGPDQRFAAAVAAFGQKLKGSNYGDMSWSQIANLANGAKGDDRDGYRAEFVQLVKLAASLKPDAAIGGIESSGIASSLVEVN